MSKKKKKKGIGGANPKPIGEVKHRIDVFIELDRITARGGTDDYKKNVKAMKLHLYKSA